ncbi:hypothetical protein CYMTET_53433 [Cymbomonas tetramitiformis]|uniref:Uncharacterized protein n=1 Tax=Cymbomonas tetramitiformis TaxID=36881 RepID=A0AAE0ERR1_9CHLO|nr:hypothetical protein CYMTET_53433 [Cymbomonas tetramitiformis]
MPTWEWRVFIRERDEAQRFWESLGMGPWPNLEECRVDCYLPVSEVLGLKMRGGPSSELECKLRLERKKRGAELWKKVIFPLEKSGCICKADLLGVCEWLRGRSESKEPASAAFAALNSVMEFWQSREVLVLPTCSVSKKRSKVRMPNRAGIAAELTEIVVDDSVQGPVWSICIEGKSAPKVYEVLENCTYFPTSVYHSSTEGAHQLSQMSIGYPLFVISSRDDVLQQEPEKASSAYGVPSMDQLSVPIG